LGSFDALHDEVMENFRRSIDKRELARREIKNVELLLNEGKFQIMPNKEHILIDKIPAMYEKLITGTWSNFFIAEELVAYEEAREESKQKYFNSKFEIKDKYKDNMHEAHVARMELIEQSLNDTGLLYIDYFNSDWIAAMQIQAMIWYKAALEKIMMTGRNYLAHLTEEHKETLNRITVCLCIGLDAPMMAMKLLLAAMRILPLHLSEIPSGEN
jgi:hypothetical protein